MQLAGQTSREASAGAALGAERARDLSPVVWVGLPLVGLAVRMLAPLLGLERWGFLMKHELGFIEIATVVFLLPAVVVSVLIFLRRRDLPRGVGWLMLVFGLAALYFAGEEASWGQHYIDYKTPEAWTEVNRQKEFNLHNIRSKYGGNVFNNLPRQATAVVIFVGGVVLPLALRRRLQRPGARKSIWYWLIPNYRLVLIAAMAIILRLPSGEMQKVLPQPRQGSYIWTAFWGHAGEFKEYCFALAMLLYVLSIYLRMGPRRAALKAPAAA